MGQTDRYMAALLNTLFILVMGHSITQVATSITLRPFNGLFSRTTSVSQHQKGEPFRIFMKQEMMGWQWHQLYHMQVICTSLQTDNHANTLPLL